MRFAKKLIRSLKDVIKIFKVGSEFFTAYGPKAVDVVREAGLELQREALVHPEILAESHRQVDGARSEQSAGTGAIAAYGTETASRRRRLLLKVEELR
jgi:hypothetical protein